MRRAAGKKLRRVAALLSVFLLTAQASANGLRAVAPEKVGMSAKHLALIDEAVGQGIARGEAQGAVVLAARRGGVVWRKAYGARALVPTREAMTADTIFVREATSNTVSTVIASRDGTSERAP